MALVKCPECGQEISDTAKNCPKCGFSLFTNQRANSIKNFIIRNIKLIIIFASVLLLVGLFWGLCSNEKYPLDSKTIGKLITENEMEHILEIKNVKCSESGDWQILRYLKEVTMEDIPMTKTIILEDNRIISVGISTVLQTSERAAFKNDTRDLVQNVDTCTEVEEKGTNIFNKLVNTATNKHGTNYKYVKEPYDESREHEEYKWILDDGVAYHINALWVKNENNEMDYSSVECSYFKEK